MTPEQTVHITRRGRWVVAEWFGDVDRVNARRVEALSLSVMLNRDAGLVVDLSNAEYLDSAAISALISMNAALTNRQQSFRIVVPHDSVLEKGLRIAGVPPVVPMHRSVEDALAGEASAC